MLGVCEQVVEQERKFYLDAIISTETLDPFKSALRVTWGVGLDVSTSYAWALFLFPCNAFYFLQYFTGFYALGVTIFYI